MLRGCGGGADQSCTRAATLKRRAWVGCPCRVVLLSLLHAEFIRVPAHSERPFATIRGITAGYSADELGSVPLAAQLMGSSKELLAAAAVHLVEVKKAPRIDLNCGELKHALSRRAAYSNMVPSFSHQTSQ